MELMFILFCFIPSSTGVAEGHAFTVTVKLHQLPQVLHVEGVAVLCNSMLIFKSRAFEIVSH
jgi:hypothetical protein